MNNRRRGFTLIELLVVIAIIAILAAILFPVFISAQESGRAAACIGNMRQIGAAVTMYVDDFGGRFPPWISYLNGRVSGNQVNMMGYMKKYLISEKLRNDALTDPLIIGNPSCDGMNPSFGP